MFDSKVKFLILTAVLTICLMAQIRPVFADAVTVTPLAAPDTLQGMTQNAATAAGYNATADVSQTGLARLVGSVIGVFISFLGVIFISYTIYGGFLWMTAAGNDEQITKAKNIIRDGAIGIIIILMSAAIYLVIRNLLLTGTSTMPTNG